jgi:hypothetical protein
MTQGSALTVIVTREDPRARPRQAAQGAGPDDATPAPAPICARASPPPACRSARAHQADDLEAAGWSELLDEAVTGRSAAGVLRMTPTRR